MKKSSLTSFKDNIRFAISKARKPLVWIEAFDYSYVLDIVCSLGNAGWIWNESSGIVNDLQTKAVFKVNNQSVLRTDTLSDSIKNISTQPTFSILVARVTNLLFSTDQKLISTLQDFVYDNNQEGKANKQTIVLVSNAHIEVTGLEHICERLSIPLPDKDDIHAELDIELGNGDDGRPVFKYPYAADFRKGKKTRENKKDLIDALYGMTLYDIRELLRSLMAESNGKIRLDLNGQKLPTRVVARKKQLVKNSGLLEVIELKNKTHYHEKVGGINGLRKYLNIQKKKIISPLYLRSKLPRPKGILLVGAPGCGKSESAKATASILDLPLYRLNIGDLLGHKYGQSENRFNEALKTADASAPCVLWIDEIEKAFAGAGNEQNNDDTLTHIIGRFLTWMQEHETLVYLVATANDLSKMRPELLRKGRWDEIFYLSYPEADDIKEIISRKRKEYNILLKDEYDNIVDDEYNTDGKLIKCAIPDDVVDKMHGMSGAEIVSILVEAAIEDFPYDVDENNDDIKIPVSINKIKNIVNSAVRQKQTSEGKNSEIENQIENELLDLKIRYIGNIDSRKEETLRHLLKEKYTKNYELKGYKSASKYDIDQ